MSLFFRGHMCSRPHTDMICLEAKYFNLNKILLQATALWPFQQSKLVRLQFIINMIIILAAIVCQINTFVTSKFTFKFALKVVSCVLFFIALIIHYGSFGYNNEVLKDLMGQLHYACTKLTDKNEISIIQKYGKVAKRYTAAIIVSNIFLKVAIWASQAVLLFYDNQSSHEVQSTNESRPHRIHIAVEYFIDQQQYYYVILLHLNAALFIGLLSFTAMGTFIIVYVQHICGMFRVACYRLEHAMENNVLKNISANSGTSISKKIVNAVNIHREAMRLAELLESNCNITYFCLTFVTVITTSLNLFQIFQAVTSADDITEAIIPTGIVCFLTLFLFLGNYFGQDIMDHNNKVYDAAYNIRWYMCPPHIQRLILLLLNRKAKEFRLTCCGMFTASFENFTTLAKATMSYFTVLYSTQ